MGEVGEVGEPWKLSASCGGAWAEYKRLRQSTMKQVTAKNAGRCEYTETETHNLMMEKLTRLGVRGRPYPVNGISDTRSNIYMVDGQH